MTFIVRYVLMTISLIVAVESSAVGWQNKLRSNAYVEPRAVAVNSAGDVVTGGFVGRKTLIARLASDTGKRRWFKRFRVMLHDLAIADNDDVLLAGGVGRESSQFWVARLAAQNGKSRWVQDLGIAAPARAFHVKIDGSGSVLCAGLLMGPGGVIVAKLDGDTGEILWRTDFPELLNAGHSQRDGIAIAANGDVVLLARIPATGQGVMLRLASATGVELWRLIVDDSVGNSAGFDSAGNIIASFGSLCLKSDAAGTELWRTNAGASASCSSVKVDLNGDVIAQNADGVMKLAGTDGSQIWRHDVSGIDTRGFQAPVVLDPANGDVLGAGFMPSFTPGITAFRLSASDGSAVWRHAVAVSAARSAYGNDGSFAFAGWHNLNTRRYGVAKLNAASGLDW